jgi:AraC-like DNA-binding protein
MKIAPETLGTEVEIRELDKKLFNTPSALLVRQVGYSRRLSKLLALISTECSSSTLNLESAACHCCVEKNHLNFLLRKATGLTFHQLLTRYRLRQAVLLMCSSDLSLLEIAQESGFGSLSSLERNFWKKFRLTPREYRKFHPPAFNTWDCTIDSCLVPIFERGQISTNKYPNRSS